VKSWALYAAGCVVAIALVGAIAWVFTSAAGQQTILASAVIALAVQVTSFTVARLLQPRHLLLGWGLGSALRLVALVIYALVVAKLWRAPLTPALLSLATFLFVTTIFEPVFLKR
jgi:hypothetical protein